MSAVVLMSGLFIPMPRDPSEGAPSFVPPFLEGQGGIFSSDQSPNLPNNRQERWPSLLPIQEGQGRRGYSLPFPKTAAFF